MHETKLTTRQAAALLILVETPGISLSQLSESLGADQATASAVIDRLLGARLVLRETDPSDRRKAQLLPTEHALRIATRLVRARRETEDRIRSALGDTDVAALAGTLARLVENLEASQPPKDEKRKSRHRRSEEA